MEIGPYFSKESLLAGKQRFNHEHMRPNAGEIEEISLLHKAEALVETPDVGSPIAPDFGGHRLRVDVIDQRLQNLSARASSAHILLDSHAPNAPAGGQRRPLARLRQDRANPDQLLSKETTKASGGGDLSDLVAVLLGKPEIAIRSCRDIAWS